MHRELAQLRVHIETLRCAPLEEGNGLLAVRCGQAETGHQLFGEGDLLLAHAPVALGDMAHQREGGFEEGLACSAAVAHDHPPGAAPAPGEECEQDADDEDSHPHHGGAGNAEHQKAEREQASQQAEDPGEQIHRVLVVGVARAVRAECTPA